MIVLDENLDRQRVFLPLNRWYRGRVLFIRDLRPRSVIKDEAIPSLLLTRRSPTFITTNALDFWGKVSPHKRYCIICLPFATERQPEVPGLIARLFRHPGFRTIARRMGKIFRLTSREIAYYEAHHGNICKVSWHGNQASQQG